MLLQALVLAAFIGPPARTAPAISAPLCLSLEGQAYPCSDPSVILCWDTVHRRFDDCAHVQNEPAGLGWRFALGAISKGIDITTTAIAIQAGAMEGNRLQPTVEHRVGFSLLEIGIVIGVEELAGKLLGPKWPKRIALVHLVVRGGVGISNLWQAERAKAAAHP